MRGFLEIDRKREAWQAEQAGLQRQRDRKVLTAALVGSAIFLLVVLAFSLAALLS
jgi:Flp pilus assembly protein TadB